jgi:hypothetical protein
LSKYHPVAVMIFGSADIMNVPWEIIIKSYRNKLGKRRFSKLGVTPRIFSHSSKTSMHYFQPLSKNSTLRLWLQLFTVTSRTKSPWRSKIA